MTVATFSQPNFNTDDPTTYRGKLDANSSVSTTIVDNFAPHAVASPNMTVQLDAGAIPGVGSMPVQVAMQTSATLTAPVANPRKDIVYIDSLTGVIGVATGAEAVSPVDPAVPALKIAIARMSMTVGMATITNSIITDLRAPLMAFAGSATFTALSANTTLTIGQSSGRFKLTGTVTITLPTPIGNSNLSFVLWGGDGNTQTINPAASSYKMPDGTTPTSYTVTANQGIEVVSDGSVYQVTRLFGKEVSQTPATSDNSTKVATTAMVQAAVTQGQPVVATTAEMQAGTVNTVKGMSPLLVAQAIAALAPVSKILQVVHYDTGAVATGSTYLPFNDTVPQSNKGDQYMSLAITPLSATSTLVIDVTYFATPSINTATNPSWVTGALFRDSAASAIGAMSQFETVDYAGRSAAFSVKAPANATTATTFKVRIGGDNGASSSNGITFNGSNGTRRFGGVMSSSIRITEIAP
jgi:hypothetical protein